MSILEGLEWDEIKERYSRLYFPLLIVNWQMYVSLSILKRYIGPVKS